MNDEKTDPSQPSDSGALIALVEDRLEGAVARVSEQARNAAALVAAAASSSGPASGADSGAGDGGNGHAPAADEGADQREEEEPAAGGDEALAESDDPGPDAAGADVAAAEAGGAAGETNETTDRAPPEETGAVEEGHASAKAGPGAGDEAAPTVRDEAAATDPEPDPRAAQDDTGKPDHTADRSAPPPRSDKEIVRLLEQIREKLASEPPSRDAQQEILETLGLIRAEQEAQNQVIAAAAADQPNMPPAWQAFQEVMARLDAIARIVRPVPVEPKEALPLPVETQGIPGPDSPALPPPAPAIDAEEVLEAVDTLIAAAATPRRASARFAWVAILVVFLAAGALGGLLQQQYTLLELPDATNGWKDRVWELTGEEIARCIAASAARGGTCAVTVEPAGSP